MASVNTTHRTFMATAGTSPKPSLMLLPKNGAVVPFILSESSLSPRNRDTMVASPDYLMNLETSCSRPTIRQSLTNFRKNSSIMALFLVLIVALLTIKAPHYELIWSVLLIFVIKAESRPQPVPVLLLAVATTITSIAVLTNYRGIGNFCEVVTVALLVLLVL